jgi:hypothetical protein
MPRFYFHVHHKRSYHDHEGAELRDLRAAWVEATTSCGEMLRDIDGQMEVGPEWRMEVTDENQTVLFILRFHAEAGPGFRPA